jgi:hypothetical protein
LPQVRLSPQAMTSLVSFSFFILPSGYWFNPKYQKSCVFYI